MMIGMFLEQKHFFRCELFVAGRVNHEANMFFLIPLWDWELYPPYPGWHTMNWSLFKHVNLPNHHVLSIYCILVCICPLICISLCFSFQVSNTRKISSSLAVFPGFRPQGYRGNASHRGPSPTFRVRQVEGNFHAGKKKHRKTHVFSPNIYQKKHETHWKTHCLFCINSQGLNFLFGQKMNVSCFETLKLLLLRRNTQGFPASGSSICDHPSIHRPPCGDRWFLALRWFQSTSASETSIAIELSHKPLKKHILYNLWCCETCLLSS